MYKKKVKLIIEIIVRYVQSIIFFFFDMFAQEGGVRFKLVTSVSLGMVLTD
jgi:hypothetical protein